MATAMLLQFRVALLALAVLGVANGQVGNRTLLGLAEWFGATEFVRLAVKVGLDDPLKNADKLSLFAFTDKGWEQLPQADRDKLEADKALLTTVLQGHVAKEVVISTNLTNELKLPTMDATRSIRINSYDSETQTASGAKLILNDWQGANGVYFSIDRVIYPPSSGTALDLVTVADNFNNFLLAVTRAELFSALQGDPLTLFAPTDNAFAKLPDGELDRILDDPVLLKNLLEYHMVPSTFYWEGLALRSNITTVLGKNLTVNMKENAVGPAKIEVADLRTSNGVVHIIDTVLLPPALLHEMKRHHHGTE